MSALYYYFYKRTALSIADPRYIQHASFLNFHFLDFRWLKFGLFWTVFFMLHLWKVLIIIPLQVLRGLELGEAGESCQIGVWSKHFKPIVFFSSLSAQAFTVRDSVCVALLSQRAKCDLMLHLLIDWEKTVWYFNHNVRSLVAFILHSMWQDKLNKLVAKPKCKWWFQYFIQD